MVSVTAVEAIPAGISRKAVKSILAVETLEGAGAVVRRSIGTSALRTLDPFLLLDHFASGDGAGFPDHPHRGQATVTYMLQGKVQHEDFAGHKGLIGPGDLQWMIAGRGIVHAEMPLHEEGGEHPAGLQLWINLPKDQKMVPPQYQELRSEQIPVVNLANGATVKVISGSSHGIESPIRHLGGCLYYDIHLPGPNARVFQLIPKGWNAFAYGLMGKIAFGTESQGKTIVDAFHTTIFSSEETAEGIELSNADPAGGITRVVIIAGEPLNQEVVQYGPFVMTSQQEISQTIRDYNEGMNGFENARTWRSSIATNVS